MRATRAGSKNDGPIAIANRQRRPAAGGRQWEMPNAGGPAPPVRRHQGVGDVSFEKAETATRCGLKEASSHGRAQTESQVRSLTCTSRSAGTAERPDHSPHPAE